MNIFKPFTSRRFNYSLAALAILALNGNALAEPVTAKVQHYYSHRREIAMQNGVWDTTSHPSPVNSIHAALLPTGKVLLIAGSGNDERQFDAGTFRSVVWDPKTEKFTDVPTPWDAFCAGHAFLPNGNLLIAGGTKKYENLNVTPKQDYQGLKDSYEFNPWTERYEKVDALDFARWYPTLATLEDGRVLAASGLDEKGVLLDGQTEIYDPETKQWTNEPGINKYLPTYPALFLTADGRLFFSGSNGGYGDPVKGRTPGFWNVKDNHFAEVGGLPDPDITETSSSVLLPPAQDQKVMILGGGGIGDSPATTSRTAIIDLDSQDPHYIQGPNLHEGMRYPNVVILPDDTVLQTGGSRDYRFDDILKASIYNPKTNTFKQVASPTVGRNYHSEALLLPDGRVAVFGSNPIDNSFEMRVEIYSPAYLFQDGARPVISGGDKKMQRGGTYELKTSNPDEVQNAKLMKPSAVTHVTDVEQRSVELKFERTSKGIRFEVPANRALVPSGYYMAFITDKRGVPSEAYWVHVQ